MRLLNYRSRGRGSVSTANLLATLIQRLLISAASDALSASLKSILPESCTNISRFIELDGESQTRVSH